MIETWTKWHRKPWPALLVATPMLGDPNFRRTVVLVVEHEAEQGTLGVVLNRPTKVPVGQVLEPWTELVTDPSVVFTGGPVSPNSALALAHVPGTDEPVGWHPLEGGAQPIPGAVARLGLVDLDAPPGLLAAAIASLRVYAGYAGWSAGQVQAEIEEGAWYVLPAEPSDAFCPEPGAPVAGRAAPPGRRARLRRDLPRRPRP